MMPQYDVIVIGGGIVGHAIAYGLQRRHVRTAILDGGDNDFRASRGNFGLIWVQGKGGNCPAYSQLSCLSAERWPSFAQRLHDATGIDCGLSQPGGINFCFTPEALANAVQAMEALQRNNPAFQFQVWDNTELRRHVPQASSQLAGAIYSPHDGHVNPLLTLRALAQAFHQEGGDYFPSHAVSQIDTLHDGFRLHTPQGEWRAKRIVLAAGLENARLGAQVDLPIPIEPIRGQVLVTERLAPFLHYPSNLLRQTQEGTVMIGDSHEHVGFDTRTRPEIQQQIAQRALQAFPCLADVQIVRGWGALRIMTPDGLPVYDDSRTCPGAYAITCHSGVTLAALHSEQLPEWILGGTRPSLFEVFHVERFSVPTAARG